MNMKKVLEKTTNYREMKLTGSIPIRPHLLKYVCWNENIKIGEAIDLKGGGNIAFILQMLLRGKLESISYDDRQSVGKDYTQSLYYVYPLRHLNEGRIFIDEKAILIFNQFLHKHFHETLNVLIIQNQKYGIKIESSIKDFMDMLGIEDEIEYDSLKKANFRLRIARNIELNSTRKCPVI